MKSKVLTVGVWFMRSADYFNPIPKTLHLYTGDVFHRRKVGEITKMQALALIRWHGEERCAYKYGSGYKEVYVCGDLDAWYSDNE